MSAYIILINESGGELDRREVPTDADHTDLSDQVVAACDVWIIGIGDTIKIVQE